MTYGPAPLVSSPPAAGQPCQIPECAARSTPYIKDLRPTPPAKLLPANRPAKARSPGGTWSAAVSAADRSWHETHRVAGTVKPMPELDFMVVADYVRTDAGVLNMVGAGFDTAHLPVVPGILTAGIGLRIC